MTNVGGIDADDFNRMTKEYEQARETLKNFELQKKTYKDRLSAKGPNRVHKRTLY